MFVQVVTAQVRPNQLDEIEQLFRQSSAGQAGRPAGLQASWLLLDRDTCKCLALTLWASEAELRAGQHLGLPPLARLLASTPTREVFELIQ